MADKVKVTESQLRKAAGRTGDVRDAISAVLNGLQTSLDGRGAPWGGDTTGKQFTDGENGYFAGREGLMQSAANSAETMDSYSKAQSKGADHLRDMDLEGERNYGGGSSGGGNGGRR
ncbi:hypothetical protein [Nocardia sp. NPDC058705]|uniref:hypothetical protein n=1 Tax=Nocardia sp. NPDC058705 TaxID=3346609 RepID=UPI0036A04ACB